MKYIFLFLALLLFVGSIGMSFYFNLKTEQIKKDQASIQPTPIPHLDAYKIYDLINDYRASKGLNKLVFDPSMCEYTRLRLKEIHIDWSHNGYKNNPPPYQYPGSTTGENLASGYYSNQEVVNNWIASPEHLKNIIEPIYTRTCIELDSDYYAVQEFASY